MKRYKNASITIERKQYEITWISDFAYHVCKNVKDKAHAINHLQIEELLKCSIYFPIKGETFVALGEFNNKIYSSFVLLSNNRCIVKTSYICNRIDLIKVYQRITP